MANRLKKMLTEEMVRLDPPLLSTPEEVIEYCGNILVENKKAKAGYVKEMIDSYQRFGPYMVMAPGLALPHARPGGNVKEPCISFVKLKEPVCFHHPCNDPVWVVFALGGVSDDGHIELLQDLSSLLAGERMIEKLAALNTYEELEKLLNTIIQKKPLHEYGMTEAQIDEFTDSVIENQQRLLVNNFVYLDRDRIRKIYTELF